MTLNPFLDPDREIVQGKSDSDILARWGDILRQRIEEAAEDAARAIQEKKETYYTRLSGTSMAGGREYLGSWESVARGIEYAETHAHEYDTVGRMTLGGSPGKPGADAVIEEAIKYAISKGLVVMAGSEGDGSSKAQGVSP